MFVLQTEDLYLDERVEAAADSPVEPQRGNEKNKQPLPVPQQSEISLIPPTIATLAKQRRAPTFKHTSKQTTDSIVYTYI